jgi:hypothetical protein
MARKLNLNHLMGKQSKFRFKEIPIMKHQSDHLNLPMYHKVSSSKITQDKNKSYKNKLINKLSLKRQVIFCLKFQMI